MRVMQVTSECFPFIKTGGLADAVAGLSAALAKRDHEVRIVLPAYRGILPAAAKKVGSVTVKGVGRSFFATVWEAPLQNSGNDPTPFPSWLRCKKKQDIEKCRKKESEKACAWFLDIPELYDREGGPYLSPDGCDWWDNGERFAVLAQAAALIALGGGEGSLAEWRADVVHAHDWQCGLFAAYLRWLAALQNGTVPRSVFTIHNAAFQGWFPASLYWDLGLPTEWWHLDGAEAWGQLNMLKAGVALSDWVTTVSQGYAEELLKGEGAFGLEGILQRRSAEGRFCGLVNGVDIEAWNPACDRSLAAPLIPGRGFSVAKRRNRAALITAMGGEGNDEAPVAGFVGRFTEQKGVDWLIESVPMWVRTTTLRLVMLGGGDRSLERAAAQLAQHFPGRVFVRIGYDEVLARQIYGGSDLFLMPSRFEPCGLAQMYAMNYGAVPVARAVGGLRDTVVDAREKGGTGFLYYEEGAAALTAAIERSYEVWRYHPRLWGRLVRTGMERDFSWDTRVSGYEKLYGWNNE